MRVLITGASGFVGRAVCDAFIRRGDVVHAVVRSSVHAWSLPEPARVIALGPIEDVADWRPHLASIDVIVHLAAKVHAPATANADYDRVNRDATARLASHATAARVQTFIFMSTVKVMGETSPRDRSFTETDEPRPSGGYARSKFEAEQILNRLSEDGAMNVSILRPPLVYGPGVGANFLALLRAVDRHVPLPIGSIDNRRSIIFVRNLASAVVSASGGTGGTFFIRDGTDLSTVDLVRAIGAALQKRPLILPLPQILLRSAARFNRRGALTRLMSSLSADDSLFRLRHRWEPPFSFAQGLGETVAWYKSPLHAR